MALQHLELAANQFIFKELMVFVTIRWNCFCFKGLPPVPGHGPGFSVMTSSGSASNWAGDEVEGLHSSFVLTSLTSSVIQSKSANVPPSTVNS